MNIGISGLGLIGGSIAKALKENSSHTVFGYDILTEAIHRSFMQKALDKELTPENMSGCDIIFLATYPEAAVGFIRENRDRLKKGSIVIDLCGIKTSVWNRISEMAAEKDFIYIGGHPMAGKEYSKVTKFTGSLFKGAFMILTPAAETSIAILEIVKKICMEIGFGGIKITTPEEHDRIIAFTSQLPHVISSAYIKSPSAVKHMDFTAGSFRDMSRISKLNEDLWTELFLENRENLCMEIDFFMSKLTEYRDAIKEGNSGKLSSLLKEGRERKMFLDSSDERRAE